MNRKLQSVFTLVVALLLTTAQTVLACPNCKAGFKEGTEAAALGEAYSASIYMLLLLPVMLVGLIAMCVVKSTREANVAGPTA